MPEGVVMVLDLLMVAWLFDVVAILLTPIGWVEVLVFVVVVVAAGACIVLVVVIFDELLVVPMAGAVWAWAERPPATSRVARKPKKRFMVKKEKVGKKPLPY